MKLALGFLLLLFAAVAPAATLTATSSCGFFFTDGTGLSSSGTTSCYVANPSGSASAGISFTSAFPSSSAAPLALSIQASVGAVCPTCKGAGASTSGTYTLTLATAGPVRNGYAWFSAPGYGGGGAADGFTGAWTLDLQTGTSSRDVIDGCGGFGNFSCGDGPVTDSQWAFPTPITLGTPLTLTETARAEVSWSQMYGGNGGGVSTTISMSFFELDGTPVQILDASAPEPATWTLAALPLALLFWRFRKRGTHTQLT